MGNPLVRLLDGIIIKKKKIPHSINALISLIVVLSVIVFLLILIIPVLIQQAEFISQVDINGIITSIQKPIDNLENWLENYGFLESNENIETLLNQSVNDF